VGGELNIGGGCYGSIHVIHFVTYLHTANFRMQLDDPQPTLTHEQLHNLLLDPNDWSSSMEDLVNELSDVVGESAIQEEPEDEAFDRLSQQSTAATIGGDDDDTEDSLSQASTVIWDGFREDVQICLRTPLNSDLDDEVDSEEEREQ
jgi:hypothetical protein